MTEHGCASTPLLCVWWPTTSLVLLYVTGAPTAQSPHLRTMMLWVERKHCLYGDPTAFYTIAVWVITWLELVPKTTLIKFTAAEIKELVNGKDVVDINELREGVRYTGGFEYGEHKTLECFWKAMESFSNQTREQVLRFVTGTSKVPLDGFDPPLTITRTEEPIETLPTAHTCFNQLVLPEYQSIDLLVECAVL